MTGTRDEPAAAPPDPNDMFQLPPLKRVDISNLIQCVDSVRKSCSLAELPTVMALMETLASAKPVPKPTPKSSSKPRPSK